MICIKCNRDLPTTSFGFRKSRSKKKIKKVVYRTWCNECVALYNRIYRLQKLGATPEQLQTEVEEITFGKENPELRFCRYCTTWKHETEFRGTGQSRKTKNRCKPCETKRKVQWAKDNLDKQKLAASRWKSNNPDKLAIYSHNRRVGMSCKSSVSSEEIKELRKFYCPDGRCMKCKEIKKLTIDHIKPIKVGGTNVKTNIQFLCQSCNSSKFTETVDYRYDLGEFSYAL